MGANRRRPCGLAATVMLIAKTLALRCWVTQEFRFLGSLPSVMASVCDICGKQPVFGNNISHSHRRTRRRWNPNIQKIRILVGGASTRAAVCTKCLKANKITKAG